MTTMTALRTAVSVFAGELGTDLDYVLVHRRDNSTVTLRQLVDALADGEGKSVTEIVNGLGVLSNPLTPHIVALARQHLQFKGKGRGETGDPVKAMLAKMTASNLADARRAAIAKAGEIIAKQEQAEIDAEIDAELND